MEKNGITSLSLARTSRRRVVGRVLLRNLKMAILKGLETSCECQCHFPLLFFAKCQPVFLLKICYIKVEPSVMVPTVPKGTWVDNRFTAAFNLVTLVRIP